MSQNSQALRSNQNPAKLTILTLRCPAQHRIGLRDVLEFTVRKLI